MWLEGQIYVTADDCDMSARYCSFGPAYRAALQPYHDSFTERLVYRLPGNGVPVVYVIVGKVVVSTLCAMIT